ncbi:MAG: PAS domain-containing protein [Phycisphaerae bacterium]|nr:PAS domain-containing protein [Phycisphaerae bacterium]
MSDAHRPDPDLSRIQGDRPVEAVSAQVDQCRQTLAEQVRAAADCAADLVGALCAATPPRAAEVRPGPGGDGFAAVLDCVLCGVILVDPQGCRIVDLNATAARLIGLPKDRILGRACHEFLCAGQPDPRPVADRGPCANRPEQVLIREGGDRLPVIQTTREVEWSGRTHWVVSFVDITAWKQAHLDQQDVLRRLEQANKELTEFAYVVSHDLRAPLRGIKTLAGWIASDQAERLDREGREQLSLLLGRVTRMEDLIQGILQYSRAGALLDEGQIVDLAELVPAILDLVAPPAHITVTLETPLPRVRGDQTRLTQVFQNLLGNAVKFMDKPQGRIQIGCIDDGAFWRFSVQDNGPGIEERHFDRIFKLFQTLAPQDESDSSGVGLAVVKKVVTFYGGRVWVESTVGKGSTFFFTLPKLGDTARPGAQAAPESPCAGA